MAGRISDRLAAKFGTDKVFIDIDRIVPGADFLSALTTELQQCDVIFAIMGRDWLGLSQGQGGRRIDSPSDFVRVELEAALQLEKPVVPILVDGATMPAARDLPVSLRPLARRNAVRVSHEEFHGDVDRLLAAVQMLVARATSAPSAGHRAIPDIDVSSLEVERVFVSHSTIDRDWVDEQIISTLSKQGIKSWYATNDIASAAQWEREIRRGLEACDWFLVVISIPSSKSEWVKDELNWAIHHRPTKIIPVVKEHCNLWDFHMRLPRLQYIDFTSDVETSRRKLVLSFVKK